MQSAGSTPCCRFVDVSWGGRMILSCPALSVVTVQVPQFRNMLLLTFKHTFKHSCFNSAL